MNTLSLFRGKVFFCSIKTVCVFVFIRSYFGKDVRDYDGFHWKVKRFCWEKFDVYRLSRRHLGVFHAQCLSLGRSAYGLVARRHHVRYGHDAPRPGFQVDRPAAEGSPHRLYGSLYDYAAAGVCPGPGF